MFWRGCRAAPDRLPGAHSNGHLWQSAQDRPVLAPNHRKNAPRKYHSFWHSFCRERTRIASLAVRMARAVIWVCSWPCNWAAILGMAVACSRVIGVHGKSVPPGLRTIALFWCARGRTARRESFRGCLIIDMFALCQWCLKASYWLEERPDVIQPSMQSLYSLFLW